MGEFIFTFLPGGTLIIVGIVVNILLKKSYKKSIENIKPSKEKSS